MQSHLSLCLQGSAMDYGKIMESTHKQVLDSHLIQQQAKRQKA